MAEALSGPAGGAPCQVCDCHVAVDVVTACMAVLQTFPLILAAAFGLPRASITLVSRLVACLSPTLGLGGLWAPLVADKLTNAQIVEAAVQESRRASPSGRAGRKPSPQAPQPWALLALVPSEAVGRSAAA